MNHQYYNVLGVMSGTSLDGIDIAHISLVYKDGWSFQIHNAETVAYSPKMKQRLSTGLVLSAIDLTLLNKEYTAYLGKVIKNFIYENQIEKLVAVCSHGHTISHRPEAGHTLQIGNLPELATIINERVVCDFRVQDVQLGGQGAPLVPIGDQLLFSNYDYCLNLGGFANVSFEKNHQRMAFDICPVNVVLNHYALLLGKEYDAGGAFAKAGTTNKTVLEKLNQLSFYSAKPPKSLGMEWVNKYVSDILEEIQKPQDVLATFTEHIAIQIAKQIPQHKSVFITGGGAFNSFLIEQIKKHSNTKVVVPSPIIVENKEALIFALLGVLRLRNEANCLASVTGASTDHSSGLIYTP